MKTMIKGGYIIAFNGEEHRILRNGVVVFEDDVIIHVGKSYSGKVDRVIEANGKLVSPGFINIHALASICITHLLLDSDGTGLNISKSFAVDGIGDLDLVGKDLETSALFCFTGLLKGGATTVVPITAMAPSRWESPREQVDVFVKTAGDLGVRAYISHHYRSAVKYRNVKGTTSYHWDEKAGDLGLGYAIRVAKKYDGDFNGRIRTMLFPYQFETCSAGLLQNTKRASQENSTRIHMHTAYSVNDFNQSLKRYGRTPIEYLYESEFLDDQVILTHVTHTTLNPECGYSKDDDTDVKLLAKSKTNIAHCPVYYSRSGKFFHSFSKFMNAGVNIGLGTDAHPMDMITEMRQAAIMGKVAENSNAVKARDVFNAATLGGAQALGRKDLGRLSCGAKADIVLIDLTASHIALVDDPIKTLVYMASQRDIDTVIVDGKTVVEKGCVLGVNEKVLASKANEINQWQKKGFVKQNPRRLGTEDLFPQSYKQYKKSN
jgi:cytosine/adenosine deaminase-related metal-dependent hydrolase